MSVQRKISLDRWDDIRGMVRGTKEDAKRLNLHLDQVKSRLMECKDELEKEHKIVTVESIKSRYLGKEGFALYFSSWERSGFFFSKFSPCLLMLEVPLPVNDWKRLGAFLDFAS